MPCRIAFGQAKIPPGRLGGLDCRDAMLQERQQLLALPLAESVGHPVFDRLGGGTFLIDGDLTIKDVTRPITAGLEVNGFTPDQDGTLRAGYTATFEINRKDCNVNFHWILQTGGAMAGDHVTIHLEIGAILQHH